MQYDNQCDQYQDHADGKRRIIWRSGDSLWSVNDNISSVHVQRHGILHRKMETICIFSDKEYVDQVLDDLTKCQGNDRQVVTFQSQYRDSNNQSEQSRNSSSDQQCQKETKSIRHHSCGAF